ncbi:MAG: hypothetical protein IKI49_06140 [Oscillospiraceae bacterium]|nr:hypothetical protein [Oscillospiraceae bacterium]
MDKLKKLLGVFIFIAALFLCACDASNTAPPPTDEGEANNTPESIVSQPIDENSSNIAPESSFQPLMDGDTSLLCPSERYDADDIESISDEFSELMANFIFEETDIDGDNENELIVKNADNRNTVVGVFNKSENGIECWLWDTYKNYIMRTLEDDGGFREYYSDGDFVLDRKIYYNTDGQRGVIVDIGKDAPLCIVFSGYVPTEEPREFFRYTRKLTVYTMDNLQTPLQSMLNEVGPDSKNFDVSSADLNFDGYLDIYYISHNGNVNYWCDVFLWDAEQGDFCENEELGNICQLGVNAENEIILERIHDNAVHSRRNYYKYIDGKLTCVRGFEWNLGFESESFLSVEDYIDGELVTVFYDDEPEKSIEYIEGEVGIWRYEAFGKWFDINYHGE